MGNLMTSFYTGVSGMHVSQTSLNTAAHNIANAETEGYTRQQVMLADYAYVKVGMNGYTPLKTGLGATVGCVRQIRDIFLDKEYRLEIGRQEFYRVQQETCKEVEDLFGELEGVEFKDTIEELWNVLNELQMNPESIVNRELLVSTANSFLENAQALATQLNDYQANLNEQITAQVKRINEIGEQIHEINFKIARYESGDEQANDFRDARNQLMDELGELTHYTYYEDINGVVSINIGNAPLVSTSMCFHMGTEYLINEDTGEPSRMLNCIWLDNGCGEVYDFSKAYSTAAKTDVGSLRGILTARGDIVANYTDIPREPDKEDGKYVLADGSFDRVTYESDMRTYEDQVRAYNNGVGSAVITTVQAQFDTLVHGVVTMLNDALCPNVSVEFAGGINGTDAEGNAVNLAGGTYKILDTTNCPVCVDENESVGIEMFERRGTSRYTVVTLDAPMEVPVFDEDGKPALDEDGNPVTKEVTELYVYNEEDPEDIYSLYTVEQLEINQDMLNNYSYLAVMKNPEAGEYGQYDVEMYADLLDGWKEEFSSLDPNSSTIYALNDYYDAMIGALGNEGFVFNSIVSNQESLTISIENKRQNVMGVSTEEEMVGLIKFQHAYSASSRYITVIDEMLEHLLAKLG